MTAASIVLAGLGLVSGGLAIVSDRKGLRRPFLIFKPLATLLIVLAALAAPVPVPTAYKAFIVAGLVCSLAGDIALMFPERGFRLGLVFFLAVQVLYILAFRPGPGRTASVGLLLPFMIYGLLMFGMLAPGLGALRIPVFVYVAAITAMAWLAAGRFIELGGLKPLLAFAGAVLFLISDSVLAYDRFGKKIGSAQVLILGTYFPAQVLIALSV
ncbi:MAG TPA: lysoplasmalogenase [Burkholderiales bacterium]|nr:lysoplasmalogenase [Burkholderiales bacterium]